MRAREIMTPRPVCCSPEDTVMDVATVMRENDCGCVPIVDEVTARLLGVVTDRDLAVRILAAGRAADSRVGDFMTVQPRWCAEDDEIAKVERVMADYQIRRVPIIDANGCCIGIVSQADLARAAIDDRRVTEHEIAIVVERISAQKRRSVAGGANVRAVNAH